MRPTVACLLICALASLAACNSTPPKRSMPPPAVLVTPVIQQDVPLYVEAIGQTRGSKEVQIQPKVSGFLQSQNYQDGALVRKGQLLYTIDPRPFSATLAQAQGQLAQSQAQLAQAKNDVAKYTPLAAEDAISRQQFDNAKTTQEAAQAAVEASKASVEAAQVNLNYTKVYSPVNGVAGFTNTQVGSLVGTGQSAALTTVTTINPFWVRFPVSEKEYLDYRKREPTEAAARNARPSVSMTLADGTRYPYKGKLTSADAQIDPTTGSLMLQAEFPNPNDVIRSGQYARVRIASQVEHGAVLAPQSAVQEVQGTYSVFVVGKDNKAETRSVQLGNQYGNYWIIEGGVKPGENVIVEGLQKARNGAPVSAKEVPPPALETQAGATQP